MDSHPVPLPRDYEYPDSPGCKPGSRVMYDWEWAMRWAEHCYWFPRRDCPSWAPSGICQRIFRPIPPEADEPETDLSQVFCACCHRDLKAHSTITLWQCYAILSDVRYYQRTRPAR